MLDCSDTLHELYNKKSFNKGIKTNGKKAAAPYAERQRREAIIKMGHAIINAAKKGDFEGLVVGLWASAILTFTKCSAKSTM